MTEAEIALIHEQAKAVFGEFLAKTDFKAGQIIVIGCSTSEVRGSRIGKDGNSAIAEALYTAVAPLAAEKGLYLAFQCCEHLNRALVVERDVAEKYDLDEVSVVPYPHAGGSMASWAYRAFSDPVVAETIQAHGGIVIGETLIGMHFKARRGAASLGKSSNRAGARQCGFHPPEAFRRYARQIFVR